MGDEEKLADALLTPGVLLSMSCNLTAIRKRGSKFGCLLVLMRLKSINVLGSNAKATNLQALCCFLPPQESKLLLCRVRYHLLVGGQGSQCGPIRSSQTIPLSHLSPCTTLF